MSKKTGLGRGLSALLPTENIYADLQAVEEENIVKKDIQADNTLELDINLLDPNREQPRKQFNDQALLDLADSILSSGIIQPLIVRANGERYCIVAGERRWRAAKIAGLKSVPALVREYSDEQIMQVALIENIQRADLNPIEEARGIQSLIDEHKLTQDEVAKRIGRSRPAVTNALRLLKLPESILELIQDGELSSGHARCLVALPNEEMQIAVASEIIKRSLSVRQAEALCKSKTEAEPENESKKKTMQYPELFEVQNQLQLHLETKVKISGDMKRGKISIEYYSEEQLERIYDYLRREQ